MVTIQDASDPTGVRDGRSSNRQPGSEAARQRQRKADAGLSLRLAGASWAEIAQTVGYPTPRAALIAVEKALVKQLNDDPQAKEKMRAIAGQRLERLLRGVWGKAINDQDPEHLAAVSRARELIGQHTKLFGLEAPTEVVVHSPTQSELEAWVVQVVSGSRPEVAELDIFDADVIEVEAS